MSRSRVMPSQRVRKVLEKPEDLEEQLLRACFRDVSLEERMQEARKPLYLKRYE